MVQLDARSRSAALAVLVRSTVAVLILMVSPLRSSAQSTTPILAWDEDPSAVVDGYAVTVDGVRSDYGTTPVSSTGACGCQIPATFMGARHTVVVSAYNTDGETPATAFVVGPTANAGGPYAAQAGAALSVTGAASTDQTATISTYAWSWGDGSPGTASSSATASHVYSAAGTFTITLTATDTYGATSSATATATVGAVAPPGVPTAPVPASGATGVSTNPTLSWSAPGATSYAVYFGTTNPPSQAAAGLTAATYQSPTLTVGTTYYWQIVASNSAGSTAGPVWSFVTQGQVAGVPTSPNPGNGATNIGPTPMLAWSDAGATSYTIRFGTANPPPQVATGLTSASYQPAPLYSATVYYWQVIAVTSAGSTAGPVWTFSTTGAQVPSAPSNPGPANMATGVSTTATLTWTDTGATSYTINFGALNPPPQVATNVTTPSYQPPALSSGTTYYWQVVAVNPSGSAAGPIWSFSTISQAPGAPATPSPATGAIGVGTTPTLTWSDTGATSYAIRFGTANPPPQVATGLTSASYQPGSLYSATTYYWQVVAVNSGASTAGPVWSFTTASAQLPSTPTAPGPANGSGGVGPSPTLSWSDTGATSYSIKFGTTNPPPQVATGLTSASYQAQSLYYGTVYYWQVVATNSAGSTAGPVWSFTAGSTP